MSIEVGSKVTLPSGEEVTITRVSESGLIGFERDNGDASSITLRELQAGPEVVALSVEQALVPYVSKLRLVYPAKSQAYLNWQTAKHGVILDPRTRPVVTGIRGGHTVQRSVAAEVEFSPNTPADLLPYGYTKKVNGTYKVNSLAVAFALLKAGATQTNFA